MKEKGTTNWYIWCTRIDNTISDIDPYKNFFFQFNPLHTWVITLAFYWIPSYLALSSSTACCDCGYRYHRLSDECNIIGPSKNYNLYYDCLFYSCENSSLLTHIPVIESAHTEIYYFYRFFIRHLPHTFFLLNLVHASRDFYENGERV